MGERGGGRVSSGGGCLQSDVGYLISGDLNLFGLNGLVVAGWGWGGKEAGRGVR